MTISASKPYADSDQGVPRSTEVGAWHAPHLVGVTLFSYLLVRALFMIPLLASATTELSFVKSTIDIVIDQAESISWLVSIGITVLSITSMLLSGHLFRAAKAARQKPTFGRLLIAGWSVLGLFLVVIRFNGANWATSSIAVGGAGLNTGGDDVSKEQALAFILALVYLACGVLAFVEGNKLFNLAAQGLIGVRRRLTALRPRLSEQYGLVNRLAEVLQMARGVLADQPNALQTAQTRLAAAADSLKSDARHRISWHLGDPGSSNITDPPSATSPTYPRAGFALEVINKKNAPS